MVRKVGGRLVDCKIETPRNLPTTPNNMNPEIAIAGHSVANERVVRCVGQLLHLVKLKSENMPNFNKVSNFAIYYFKANNSSYVGPKSYLVGHDDDEEEFSYEGEYDVDWPGAKKKEK